MKKDFKKSMQDGARTKPDHWGGLSDTFYKNRGRQSGLYQKPHDGGGGGWTSCQERNRKNGGGEKLAFPGLWKNYTNLKKISGAPKGPIP